MPEDGLKLVILGSGGVTVKVPALANAAPTWTSRGPVVAPVGTGTTMVVALQLVGVPAVPLNVTALVPCVAPKFAPKIVTDVPTAPDPGLTFEMMGDGMTVKFTPLLAKPPTVTTTLPVVVPEGTGATTLVSLQLVDKAGIALKVTELNPRVAPKLVPLIVTEVPAVPDVGFKLVMLGVTEKNTELLATPPTVTTTFPPAPMGTGATMLDALQLVGVAAVPLNVTVLVPCVAPKFAPVIVTEVPTGPEVGLRVVILGPGEVTVNATPLLANPPTVTTTLPVVAPFGTDTTMLESLQLVAGPAAVPLNVTVLTF